MLKSLCPNPSHQSIIAMDEVAKRQGKMLLIKLPDALYQALHQADQSADSVQSLFDIGVLNVNEGTGDCEIQLNNALQKKLNQSSIRMKLQPLDSSEALYVFSVDGQGRAVLKCPVVQKMSIVPQGALMPVPDKPVPQPDTQMATYTVDPSAQDRNRRVLVFHLHPDQKMFTMMNSDVGAEVIARRERAEKRVRGDREDVKRRLFDLFHEKKYWKTKNLAEETDQPDQFVNEILSEIAIKVENGPHRKCWTLKPEYGGGESSDEGEDSTQKKRRF